MLSALWLVKVLYNFYYYELDARDRIFLIICFIWVASDAVLNYANRSKDTSKDQSSFWILVVTDYSAAFAGVYIALMQGAGNILWGNPYLNYLGLTFVILGLTIRWVAIYTLKRQFTVNVVIIQNHQLVNAGIYNYVRHPAYLGSLLSFLGLALYFGNWISFVVIFFPTLFAILNRIAVEEKVLINHFGREYIDYAKKTKRLIPNIY